MYSSSPSKSPSLRSSEKASSLWLCLRFEQLALDALRGLDAKQPIDFVIYQHRVIAVSPQALAQGLSCGMSVNHARMIAPHCQGRERDLQQEQQHLEALAHWAYRYTPQVSVGRQCLLLEVGHCLKLFKGFQALFQHIQEDLSRFLVSPQLGVAHTPTGAYLLSFSLNNGVQVAQSNNTDADIFLLLLGQVAIDYLDIDKKIIAQLQGCGFEILEELLAAPREEIGQRFGRGLLDYLARLLGEKDDPQQTITPPDPFLLVRDFAEPIHNRQWIEQCTDEMLQQFCDYLRRRQWFCQLLVWRFYNGRRLIESLTIPLASKHHNFDSLKRLTDLHLETLRLDAELMRIELFSDKLLSSQLFVDDLFDPQIKEHEVAELVDKLSARLGDKAVYQLADAAQQLPELSVVLSGFSAARRSEKNSVVHHPVSLESQPLWLLSPPQALSSNCYSKGQPLDSRGRPIQLIQGPDRIDSHWWCAELPTVADVVTSRQCRDYFIARQYNGRLLWLFYDRRDKQWFLHGLFG